MATEGRDFALQEAFPEYQGAVEENWGFLCTVECLPKEESPTTATEKLECLEKAAFLGLDQGAGLASFHVTCWQHFPWEVELKKTAAILPERAIITL